MDTTATNASTHYWTTCFKPAWMALRTYWLAIVLIQGIAFGVVLSYYWLDGAQAIFARVAEFKGQFGALFAAVCTVFSGGVFPELIKRIFRPKGIAAPSLGELLHQFVMWAWVGVLIDRFYALQSHLFGDGHDVFTLVMKMLVDQFVFTPLVCLPLIALWFMLREAQYNLKTYRGMLRLSNVFKRMMPLWAICLIFWPVMLCIVYSLPVALQFPLFLLGNSAYSIMMIFIVRRQVAL